MHFYIILDLLRVYGERQNLDRRERRSVISEEMERLSRERIINAILNMKPEKKEDTEMFSRENQFRNFAIPNSEFISLPGKNTQPKEHKEKNTPGYKMDTNDTVTENSKIRKKIEEIMNIDLDDEISRKIFYESNYKDIMDDRYDREIDMTYKYWICSMFMNNEKEANKYLVKLEDPTVISILRGIKENEMGNSSYTYTGATRRIFLEWTSEDYMDNPYRYKYTNMDIANLEDYKIVVKNIRYGIKSVINLWLYYIETGYIDLDSKAAEILHEIKSRKKQAYFYLGEYYNYMVKDRDLAVENYLRSETSMSQVKIGILNDDVELLENIQNPTPSGYYHLYEYYTKNPDRIKKDHSKYRLLTKSLLGGYLPAVVEYNKDNKSPIGVLFENCLLVNRIMKRAYKEYLTGNIRTSLNYYLYLSAFGMKRAMKNAITILEKHNPEIENSSTILFRLYQKTRNIEKIGDCYYYGKGVEKDYKKSITYYMRMDLSLKRNIRMLEFYSRWNPRKALSMAEGLSTPSQLYVLGYLYLRIFIIWVSSFITSTLK